ncbi:MAG: DUF4079 family protein [Myxococcota bacterium]
MRWLAYLHPALMLVVLALGVLVLREGLRGRRARLAARSYDTLRHRRLARIFVPLVVLGFGAGAASMGLLRGRPLFESFHGGLVLVAGPALLLAGLLGLRLERRPHAGSREIHALLGALGLLLALAAGVAGFAILP